MSEPKQIHGLHDYLSKIRSIEEAFAVYHRFVIPRDASEAQVRETRRAFFAAADWFYKRFLQAVDDEEAAMKWLSEIHAEITAHCKAVQEGRG